MPSTEKAAAAPDTDRIATALELLAQTNAAIVSNTPVHRMSFDEWLAKNPAPKLPFPLFQNGFKLEADALTAAQIALIPKLKEGRFFDRRIHVYRDATPDRGWHIDYPNKSIEDRMILKDYGREFTEILQRLTTEEPDRT